MAGAHILDLVDAHVAHNQVLVAHFGIAETLVAGAEQYVAALGAYDGVDILHRVGCRRHCHGSPANLQD